jgi:hypothetical protein
MKFLALLLVLFSFSAIAGDSYIICASLDYNGDFLDQEFAIDEYIMDSNVIRASHYDIPDDLYKIEYIVDTKEFIGQSYDVHLGELKNEVKATLEYYELVKISEQFGCMLTD